MVTEFTPLESLLGGLIIGTATLMLLLLNGKVAGVSGILKGTFLTVTGDRLWRLLFLLGLVCGGALFVYLKPESSAVDYPGSVLVMSIAGLLVGLGTGVGSGCTSGHGICGLSRFSLRSLVATLSFMALGFLSVYVFRHVMGVI